MQALQRPLATALLRQQVAAVSPGDPGDHQQPLATSPLAQLCQPTCPSQGRPLRALRGAVGAGGLKGSTSEDRAGGQEPEWLGSFSPLAMGTVCVRFRGRVLRISTKLGAQGDGGVTGRNP